MSNTKIAYVCDGSIIFNKEQLKNNKDLYLLKFSIINKNNFKEYDDDITKHNQDFFIKQIYENEQVFKSSQPNNDQIDKLISFLINKKKYDKVVFWLIHPDFSGTYKTVNNYVKSLDKKIQSNILVLYTKNFLLDAYFELQKIMEIGNYTNSLHEITKYWETITPNNSLVAIISNLSELLEGGRFSRSALLKPILKKQKFFISFYLGEKLIVPKIFLITRGINKIFLKYSKLIKKKKFHDNKYIIFYFCNEKTTQFKNIIDIFKILLPNYKVCFVQWPNIFTIIFGNQSVIEIPTVPYKDFMHYTYEL